MIQVIQVVRCACHMCIVVRMLFPHGTRVRCTCVYHIQLPLYEGLIVRFAFFSGQWQRAAVTQTRCCLCRFKNRQIGYSLTNLERGPNSCRPRRAPTQLAFVQRESCISTRTSHVRDFARSCRRPKFITALPNTA